MSQHDMNIENQGFPAFRSDLNNALAALASTSAGTSAPSTPFAQQLWYDSTNNLLKMRNTDNDAWITLAYFDQTNDEWEVRSAVIQAVDSAGVTIKNDGGTTLIEAKDDGTVVFRTDDVTIDASGNLLVGKTSASYTTVGSELRPDGRVVSVRSGNPSGAFVRTTSDGDIVEFYKDAGKVGSIGTSVGRLTIGNGDAGLRFADDANTIIPWNVTTNGVSDNSVTLGASTARFKDLYLSGGVYLGGTGAANYLDDYEEGTFTATFADESSGGNTSTTASIAEYVKVGDMVNLVIHMSGIDTTGLTSGNPIFIQGMPFNSKQANWGSARLSGISFSGFVTAQIQGDYIRLRENISGSSNFMTISDVTDDDGQIYLTVTYRIS